MSAPVAAALPADWAQAIVRAQTAFDPWAPWLLAVLGLAALAWWARAPAAEGHARVWRLLVPAAVLLALWAVLAAAMARGAPALAALDAAGVAWAGHAGGLPAVTWLAVRLSDLGDLTTLALLTAVVGAVLLAQRQHALALGWLLAIGMHSLSVRVLKNLFARARPAAATEWLTSGYSFPSGHAAGALMVYGLLTWLLCRRAPRPLRPAVGSAGAALVAGIAASRVWLGVHHLSDVLGGLLWAGAALLLAIGALRALAPAAVN